MNNRVDTTLPRSALLGMSAHTESLFQTWIQLALASMAVSPSKLTEEQTAVVTITAHARDESAPQAPTVTSTHQATHFPNTTCTLHWQSGRWVIASMSSLTHIEETAPPCCEHAFLSPPM